LQLAPVHSSPDAWIRQIFSAKAAAKGGVTRRSVGWVDREIGREKPALEVRCRGFHMIRAGGQFVIICCQDEIRLIC